MSYGTVLALPGVAPLLFATTLARLATRMFLVAVVLYVLARFGSPVLAGWVGFAALIPGMIISPLAGALLDRIGAGRAILADLAASALLLAILATAAATDTIAEIPLLLLCGLYSLTSPLSAAGIRTLLPRMVPPEARDPVNALDTTANAGVDIVGPVLAGPLVGFLGAPACFATVAVLFALATLAAARAQAGATAPAPSPGGLLAQALVGLRYVLGHAVLRGLALSYSLQMVSWGVLLVAVPVAVTRTIGPGPASDSLVGLLWAAAGCAGILGALVAGRIGILGREGEVIALGGLVTAFALFPIAALFGLAGLAAGMMLLNAAAGPVDVAVLTLRQRRTDPALLGRVTAVSMSINLCGLPIGSALGGMLVTQSVTLALSAAAVASLLSAMAARAMLRA